jgi:hypothetical protein
MQSGICCSKYFSEFNPILMNKITISVNISLLMKKKQEKLFRVRACGTLLA